jgi:hypothetical protein
MRLSTVLDVALGLAYAQGAPKIAVVDRDAERSMPRIFISYRRDDAAPYAGRLFADLGDHFQRSDLIMDIDSTAPGENFVEFIREAVGSCDVLLALIGKRWLTVRDALGGAEHRVQRC